MDDMVGGNEFAFPLGLHGRKEHTLRTPVVRLMLPAGHPLVEPPFPLPGRACWEILREGAFPYLEEEAENNRYTFILWNVASSYQSWVTASLDGKASQKDPVVVLHAAEEVVPHQLAKKPILKVSHQGSLHDTLFRLVGAMVLPAVFQSVIGADPVDIARLSRSGGNLHVDFVEANDVENLWVGMERCWESRSFPRGRLKGLVFAIMAPSAVPVLTSSGLLDSFRWERLLPGDDTDLVVTLFGRKDERVSATLLRILQP